MPNKPSPSKTTWALWISKDLLVRFRAVVPRGKRQDAVRAAIAALVEDLERRGGAESDAPAGLISTTGGAMLSVSGSETACPSGQGAAVGKGGAEDAAK